MLFTLSYFPTASWNSLPPKMPNGPFASFPRLRSSVGRYSFAKFVLLAPPFQATHSWLKDREYESRFGATPVPGKIGMAMAGQGLHAQPPPRPPHHNYFGTHQNPGNQLYVGNVCYFVASSNLLTYKPIAVALPSRLARFERFVQGCWKHHPC